MGSFGGGDHRKGENPELAWVQRGIDAHNEKCRQRAAAAPLWRKILAVARITGPYIQWQRDHWYDRPPSVRGDD